MRDWFRPLRRAAGASPRRRYATGCGLAWAIVTTLWGGTFMLAGLWTGGIIVAPLTLIFMFAVEFAIGYAIAWAFLFIVDMARGRER